MFYSNKKEKRKQSVSKQVESLAKANLISIKGKMGAYQHHEANKEENKRNTHIQVYVHTQEIYSVGMK